MQFFPQKEKLQKLKDKILENILRFHTFSLFVYTINRGILMEKKAVLITGAGSGLGKRAAIELARRGHKVYATTHYSNQIGKLEFISKKEHLDITSFKLDILMEKDRNLILDYDIDVLICNAAIGDSGSVADIFIDRTQKVFETNVFCNLRLTQLALRKMITQKKTGRIIFLSSLAGRIPFAFLSPYCASKASIEIFATCLRKEMKKLNHTNIEVSIIEPGAYATGFNKENNEKKYNWMYDNSYFKNQVEEIRKKEKKLWNVIEVKPYDSIVRKYIRAVEDRHLKHRYSAPWWQTIGVQIGRILER